MSVDLENTTKEVIQETRQNLDVWINNQIHDNDFLIATLAAFVLATVGYTCRRVPYLIFDFLRRRLTCVLTINNDIDRIQYNAINEYLLKIYKNWWSKNYLLGQKIDSYDEDTDVSDFTLTPGYGFNFAFFEKRLVFIDRRLIEDTNSSTFKEQIELRFLSRKTDIIERFINKAINFHKKDNIQVYGVTNYTEKICTKPFRNFNSVFINQETKNKLVKTVDWFINNKQWYRDRGIPYKLGILLHGTPGTGKTSLIHALVSYLERDLYLVRPSRLSKLGLFNTNRAIVLLEDIDTDNVVNGRNNDDDSDDDDKDENKNTVSELKNNLGDNLGDILNYFDGFKTPDGIIFIMTTNHLNKLDTALFRKGRIDLLLEIDKMDYNSFANMYKSFFNKELMLDKKDYIPVTGSEAQDIFINTDAEQSIEVYKERVYKNKQIKVLS